MGLPSLGAHWLYQTPPCNHFASVSHLLSEPTTTTINPRDEATPASRLALRVGPRPILGQMLERETKKKLRLLHAVKAWLLTTI